MERKDSIIVLSGLLTQDRRPDEDLKQRIIKSVELFRKGIADSIIMNGGPGKIAKNGNRYSYIQRDSHPMACEVMRDYAISLGVPKSRILMQDYSSDTVGEAYFVKEMVLAPRGWKNNVIVTNKCHEKRARVIYDFILGPNYRTGFECIETDFDRNPEMQAKEKESLELFLKQFKGMKPGDSRAIERALYESHALYSKIPEKERLCFYNR